MPPISSAARASGWWPASGGAIANRPVTLAELTPGEREQMRSGDWLLGRAALKGLLGGADTSGVRFPDRCLSLTHAGGLAVAVAADGDQRGVGVDYERDHAVDPRTARFFVREGEDGDLLQLWTVKEALFKATPANEGAVLRDYLITGPVGAVDERGNTFEYGSRRWGGGWLTVAVCR